MKLVKYEGYKIIHVLNVNKQYDFLKKRIAEEPLLFSIPRKIHIVF